MNDEIKSADEQDDQAAQPSPGAENAENTQPTQAAQPNQNAQNTQAIRPSKKFGQNFLIGFTRGFCLAIIFLVIFFFSTRFRDVPYYKAEGLQYSNGVVQMQLYAFEKPAGLSEIIKLCLDENCENPIPVTYDLQQDSFYKYTLQLAPENFLDYSKAYLNVYFDRYLFELKQPMITEITAYDPAQTSQEDLQKYDTHPNLSVSADGYLEINFTPIEGAVNYEISTEIFCDVADDWTNVAGRKVVATLPGDATTWSSREPAQAPELSYFDSLVFDKTSQNDDLIFYTTDTQIVPAEYSQGFSVRPIFADEIEAKAAALGGANEVPNDGQAATDGTDSATDAATDVPTEDVESVAYNIVPNFPVVPEGISENVPVGFGESIEVGKYVDFPDGLSELYASLITFAAEYDAEGETALHHLLPFAPIKMLDHSTKIVPITSREFETFFVEQLGTYSFDIESKVFGTDLIGYPNISDMTADQVELARGRIATVNDVAKKFADTGAEFPTVLHTDEEVLTAMETAKETLEVAYDNKHKDIEDVASWSVIEGEYPYFKGAADDALLQLISSNMVAGNDVVGLTELYEQAESRQQFINDVYGDVYISDTQNPYSPKIEGMQIYYYNGKAFLKINYKNKEADMAQNAALKAKVDEGVAAVTALGEQATDRDKALAINNFVIKAGYYDHAAVADTGAAQFTYAHRAYGILVLGKGVCESYAQAYKAIADAAGLESVVVDGTINKDGGGHAWIKIKIDGAWRVVDPTWNDSDSDSGGAGVSERYFDVSDAQIETPNAIRYGDTGRKEFDKFWQKPELIPYYRAV